MSDNKIVPSADKFKIDYDLEQYDEGGYIGIDERQASKMLNDFARLHLEAMLKEITSGDEKVLLKRDIEKTGNNYTSKIQ